MEGAMRCLEEPARLAQDRIGCGGAPSQVSDSDTCLTVEMLPTEALKPYAGNARTHSKKQIRQIAKSIEHFGFCNPVLIDNNRQIIAGHGRVAAAKLLRLSVVPTVSLSHLSEAQKRAYILADNRLAEKAARPLSMVDCRAESVSPASSTHRSRGRISISCSGSPTDTFNAAVLHCS
jgi:hypothetical protein